MRRLPRWMSVVALGVWGMSTPLLAQTPQTVPGSVAKPAPAKVLAAPAEQDPITITTRVEPKQPRVGDLITYQINVAYPQGVSVNLPRLLDLKPLNLVSRKELPEASSGQGLRRQFELVLQAFSLDNAKIPSFELTYVDASAQVRTKRVPAIALEMRAMTANEAEPERRGEDPMVSPEYPNTKAEWVIYSVLGGSLLAALIYALWRWLAPRREERVVVPVVPPHQLATQRLDRLEEGLAQRFADGAGVLFYLELTEVAKTYLGSRYGVECLDRTTDEIDRELKRDARLFGPVQADSVTQFLRNCDLIKFARVATDLDDARLQLQEVRTWVDVSETAEPEAEETGEPSSSQAPNDSEPSPRAEEAQSSGNSAADQHESSSQGAPPQ